MTRVAHFEICVRDVARAVDFYRHAFDWEIRPWDGPGEYWIVVTGDDADVEGINGAIRPAGDGAGGAVNLVDVPDLDHALLRVVEAGGTIVATRTPVAGVGYVAYCRDPEGIPFGLIQRDDTAAG